MNEPRTSESGKEWRVFRDRVMREHCGEPWSEQEEFAMSKTFPYAVARLQDELMEAFLPMLNVGLRGINWLVDRMLRPATKPCPDGCGEADPHDAHLTLGYRLRLKLYGMFFRA